MDNFCKIIIILSNKKNIFSGESGESDFILHYQFISVEFRKNFL